MNQSNLNGEFWKDYYKTTTHNIKNNSSFSDFVYNNYIDEYNKKNVFLKIADLGGGNCRDSNFFAQKGNMCYAVDINGQNTYGNPNCKLITEDVEDLLRDYKLQTLFDVVYMRWFLHAMPYKKSENVFNHAVCNLKPNGILCIEVRSLNDEELTESSVYDKDDQSYITTHKRWLYSKDLCIKLAEQNDCEVLYCEEGHFSPNPDTETHNPLLIRTIIQKKRLPYYETSENYSKYQKIVPLMKTPTLTSYEDMDILNAILEKHDIQYIALAGTMIGLNRHGGIIPWDNDIDIGFVDSDWKKLFAIKDELIENGLKIHIPPTDHVAYDKQCHFGAIDCFRLELKGDYYQGVADVFCHKDEYKHAAKQIFGYTYVYAPFSCIQSLSHRYRNSYFYVGDVNDNYHFKDRTVPRFTLNNFDRSYQIR